LLGLLTQAMHSAVYTITTCLSIHQIQIVTIQYCVKMAKHILNFFSHLTVIVLVFSELNIAVVA